MRELDGPGQPIQFPNRLEGRTPPRRDSLLGDTLKYLGTLAGATVWMGERVIAATEQPRLPANVTDIARARRSRQQK